MNDNNLTTEDAITVLRNLQDWLYFSAMNGGTSIQRKAIDMAIRALKSQPSELHWIPVTEKLPEYGVDCLVTVKQKYPWQTDWEYFVDLGWRGDYIDGAWDTANDWDEGQETHISAWMPKPEPFKEGM